MKTLHIVEGYVIQVKPDEGMYKKVYTFT